VKATAALLLLLGCAHGSPVAPQAPASEPRALVELIALIELPRGDATEGLSGTQFDPDTGTLLAVQDKNPRVVPLRASADFRSWSVGTPIELRGRPQSDWDGEAIARAGDELFIVAVESHAVIERFTLAGEYRAEVPVPEHFTHARANKGIEALAASPSGRYLFFANEAALESDGALATRRTGTLVRIVRRALHGDGYEEERLYRSEPLAPAGSDDGEMGVSDLAALSDDELLVLERGYQPGYGNTTRIFRVEFVGPPSGAGAERTPLRKSLLADLGALPAEGISHPSPQPNPVLENYEALSIGPWLPDDRRLLFVTSDDNARPEQRARILVLAVRLN
jgi:hypothetical protein